VTGTGSYLRPVPGRGAQFKSLVDRQDSGPRLSQILSETGEQTWAAIHAAVLGGLGVLIASTSDGGAISVTCYQGDERLRSYASSREEWLGILEALRDTGDAASVGMQQAAKTQRMRR